jgi:hypothetical protein
LLVWFRHLHYVISVFIGFGQFSRLFEKKCRKAGLLANLYQAGDGLSLVRSNIINPIKNGQETGRYFTKMIRRRIKTRGKGALSLACF